MAKIKNTDSVREDAEQLELSYIVKNEKWNSHFGKNVWQFLSSQTYLHMTHQIHS